MSRPRANAVGGDVIHLSIWSIDLDNLRVIRSFDELPELNAVLVVQGDQGRNQVGSGLAAFAPIAMAVAAGGVVQGKAAVNRVPRIDLESRTPAAASAATSASSPASPAGSRTSRRCGGRRLRGGRLRCRLLGLQNGDHGKKGKSTQKCDSFIPMHSR